MDRTIDERALEATREVLIEQGFDRTSIPAVAKRAGVHTSALYRRWSSKLDLIEEAVLAGLPPRHVRPTGDLRADLRRFLQLYIDTFAAPAVRAAAPGLMTSYQSGTRRPSEALLHQSPRATFRELVAADLPAGTDPAVDPDEVFDLLLGAVLFRTVVPQEAQPSTSVAKTVDLLIRLLQDSR